VVEPGLEQVGKDPWQSLRTTMHTQASIIFELRYSHQLIVLVVYNMEDENILEKIIFVFATVDIDTTAIIASIQSFS
jgi:hypothetical protein